jgi:hypothetical protein
MTTKEKTVYDKLYEMIIKHSGMSKEEIIEAGEHGANTGWPGFTYYSDTCKFWAKNKSLIMELAEETANGLGEDLLSMIQNFRCLSKTDYKQSEIADALYSAKPKTDKVELIQVELIQNAMAWFALEEVGRWLAEKPEETEE